jgi:hypothetical protein
MKLKDTISRIYKKVLLWFGIVTTLSGIYKTIDTVIIQKIKENRLEYINLKNRVNTMSDMMAANRDIEFGYYIVHNGKEVEAYIVTSKSGDKHVKVEDGKAHYYGLDHQNWKKESFYIDYEGEYTPLKFDKKYLK